MERKKTNEIYVLNFDKAMESGRSTATRGLSFLWNDVIQVQESSIIKNCTVVKTTFSEFTINEEYSIVDGEWSSFLQRAKLGITLENEHD